MATSLLPIFPGNASLQYLVDLLGFADDGVATENVSANLLVDLFTEVVDYHEESHAEAPGATESTPL